MNLPKFLIISLTNVNLHMISALNMSIENRPIERTLATVQFKCSFNSRTCHHSHIPNCTDQILTNQKSLFKFSKAFKTGLSDHHKLISTAIKSDSSKGSRKQRRFRDVVKSLTLQY